MNVPVLFCIFNRLDTVKKTFMPVKKARPQKLYIASDGPRLNSAGEAAQVEAVREYILSQIDFSRLYFASLVYWHMLNTYGFETDIKKLQADTKDLKCQVAPLKLKLQLLPFHRKDKRDERLLRAAQIDRLIEYNTSFCNLLKRYPDWPSLIQRPVQD